MMARRQLSLDDREVELDDEAIVDDGQKADVSAMENDDSL
jgi:hypothetical protein